MYIKPYKESVTIKKLSVDVHPLVGIIGERRKGTHFVYVYKVGEGE